MAVASAAAVVAASLIGTPAQANHSWGNYHWARTANPFTIKLDRNVTSTWNSYLSTASSDWTASSKLNTTIQTGSFGSRTSCTATTGHVEVCNAAYGTTGWLGVASISITTGNHISRGSVKLNDTYFAMAQYNTPSWRQMVTSFANRWDRYESWLAEDRTPETVAKWGTLVEGSASHGFGLFVRDLGGGNLTFTRVIWAS
ncbi:MAG: hypothetical protein ACM30G_12230 [Micromonosporaceae bacterium]